MFPMDFLQGLYKSEKALPKPNYVFPIGRRTECFEVSFQRTFVGVFKDHIISIILFKATVEFDQAFWSSVPQSFESQPFRIIISFGISSIVRFQDIGVRE